MARADDEYLFDALKKPAYRKAWTAMLSGEKNIPGWLIAFGKGGPGVAGPLKTITVEGRKMQASNVCKPHDCAGNELHIFFSLDASSAIGSLTNAPAISARQPRRNAWRSIAPWLIDQRADYSPRRTSGGMASSASIASASSSDIDTCCCEPSRRIDTVRSAASLRPATSITGIFASECSRTL